MTKLKVLNQLGENVGEIELNDAVFGIEPNTQAMFDAVNVARSNSRQATAKTKKRDEVSGGGKKPFRQKGTGRARAGSTRAPQWRHGGVVFGPDGNQNYKIKINRKVRDLALRSALSSKVKDSEMIVVDKFEFAAPKTKEMVKSLEKVNAKGKTLIIVGEESFNDNAMLSAFNIPTVGLLYVDQVNVYDLLNCDTVIFTKEAVEIIEEVLLDGKN
ncbi:MAG: 50S ribosomal protein L4 [Bacilli bacterium]|nr:50S ribosomal protein L4 [Bacilli bacterium]MDD4584328.1 50S ribosomal protein L4 [Bacilli bacterium]